MEMCVDWDADDFASYLTERGMHKDVVTNITNNRITSALFLSLSEDDLKQLAPMIGDRIVLRKILEEARKVRENIMQALNYRLYSVKEWTWCAQ